jgi:broad-specificity NMP kinase
MPAHDPAPIDVALLCGAAGVGKSTVAFELSRLLVAADVAHALVDTDELDRVHPWPPHGLAPSELSRRNLASVWLNIAALGHDRLILVGVFVDLAAELPWIEDAVPGCRITVVRLRAERPELEQRVRQREIGSGAEDQLGRTLAQVSAIDDPPDVAQIDTSALDVSEVAELIVGMLGWLEDPGAGERG